MLALALLLLVAVAQGSAAKPPLGPRGWAPGDLPVHLDAVAVTAILAAAYGLGALGVWLGWRSPARGVAGRRWALLLGALALLTSPMGSADHTNYAAYGRIAVGGGDPYVVPPVTWGGGTDPVTSLVEPPWQQTPSVYGPVATALQAVTSWVGGDNLRQTVWVWQVVVVLCWLGVRWLVQPVAGSRTDLLWTFNPVVYGVVVLGAHVDVVAAVLAVAACRWAARTPRWAAFVTGLLVGAAASTKITANVVAFAVVWAWRGRPGLVRRVALLALGAGAVVLPAHLWAGRHVFEQLGEARRSVSLATPWRLVVELAPGSRDLVFLLAGLTAMVLVLALARQADRLVPLATLDVRRSALVATFALTTAYTLAAPYALPWYDALTFATLPALAASALDAVLLARLTVLAWAYVPGRVVGMTPGVQAVTLGFRRHVAPYAVLLTWVGVLALARAAPGRTRR